jgi:hypothetical protein
LKDELLKMGHGPANPITNARTSDPPSFIVRRATVEDSGAIASGEGPVWLALNGARVVGTVAAVLKQESAYIRSMAIAPNARGHGALFGTPLFTMKKILSRRPL